MQGRAPSARHALLRRLLKQSDNADPNQECANLCHQRSATTSAATFPAHTSSKTVSNKTPVVVNNAVGRGASASIRSIVFGCPVWIPEPDDSASTILSQNPKKKQANNVTIWKTPDVPMLASSFIRMPIPQSVTLCNLEDDGLEWKSGMGAHLSAADCQSDCA